MYLGLDLRGGVHFLLQIDMKGARQGRRSLCDRHPLADARQARPVRRRVARRPERRCASATRARDKAASRSRSLPDLGAASRTRRAASRLVATPEARGAEAHPGRRRPAEHHDAAQPGERAGRGRADRAAAGRRPHRRAAPGVQDTARAKDILGRTATLEIRMVNDDPGALEPRLAGQVPFGTELYVERGGAPVLVRRRSC